MTEQEMGSHIRKSLLAWVGIGAIPLVLQIVVLSILWPYREFVETSFGEWVSPMSLVQSGSDVSQAVGMTVAYVVGLILLLLFLALPFLKRRGLYSALGFAVQAATFTWAFYGTRVGFLWACPTVWLALGVDLLIWIFLFRKHDTRKDDSGKSDKVGQ